MTHHILDKTSLKWISKGINCFLIRDPADVINSYITLKNREIKKYNSSKDNKIGFKKSKSNKSNIITQWERDNTLDC